MPPAAFERAGCHFRRAGVEKGRPPGAQFGDPRGGFLDAGGDRTPG